MYYNAIYKNILAYFGGVMSKDTITFRLDPEKREALDEIAAGLDRDRSYILNEAIDLYLEVYRWQVEHILDGVRQADNEEFATDDEVEAAFSRWRR
jgi:RHH-type transcriptional regulator, rel operon repressor / antitoxin RelB